MAELFRELRHLNALVAFEAAARCGNFTRAADELSVTRVAISRQIKTLEDDLETELFSRQHRGVVLTAEGQQLFDTVSASLRDIADTKHQIRYRRANSQVSVTMTAAFASFWLIPRLGRFNELYPDIELRLVVADKYLDLKSEVIDAAIRWGDVGTEGNQVEPLFAGGSLPLCSREFKARMQPSENPEDLLHARLIHLEGSYRADAKWPDWFQKFGIEVRSLPEGIVVDSYSNMIQAAISGQGIALGDTPMLDNLINEGVLIPALDVEPIAREYFYLVVPKDNSNNAATSSFCNWLRAEVNIRPNSCQ